MFSFSVSLLGRDGRDRRLKSRPDESKDHGTTFADQQSRVDFQSKGTYRAILRSIERSFLFQTARDNHGRRTIS